MTMKLDFGNNGGGADVSALADKIAELSSENATLTAERDRLRRDIAEAGALVEQADATAQQATEWKNRAEAAEAEIATLKDQLKQCEQRYDDMTKTVKDAFSPLHNAETAFRDGAAAMKSIISNAEIMNKAAKTAKETADQYDGSRSWKDVIFGIGEYVLIGVFLFGCSYMGSVYGETPEKIENIRDLVYRIAYNQYFNSWGIEPINPFINGVDATKIWNATYNNWIEQQQQPQEPQE